MKYWGLFFGILLVVSGCIDPFKPADTSLSNRYLVVSGFLNTGGDTTVITLSRTQPVNDNTPSLVESGASIQVGGDRGTVHVFQEIRPGTYILTPRRFVGEENLRIQIRTRDGKTYVSDYVPARQSPAIDSVTWQPDRPNNLMRFLVHTHDPSNNSRFYRWKIEETYQYQSAYYSGLEVVKQEIVPRVVDVYSCWRTDRPTNILIGTSAKLSEDRIQSFPLVAIHNSSNKLLVKYSLLVKQYTLTQAAYEYWDMLARTSETTGGLFDPQPSLITGNIRCESHPEELAFGFFSAGTERSFRLTVRPIDFNGWFPGTYPRCSVEPDTLSLEESVLTSDNGRKIIGMLDMPTRYLFVPSNCADCRSLGGSLNKPSWF
ncbi:hypothetical protein BWI97_17350 [Siphonobacter sp. BAB-5405]|uniref:DUF4249 domain-containing protein n=1 Tax=Siphonobacter sp. BAB-5405 TaxID=1864825 RepID=UPI000C801128|nr:DUF4249 domain-containing protein [Siphonobacter sp. BAB-5405]PMD94032.1 hypothetical protein BWI97_17350 [Siphonobacter sp. BAB-5405]